jgi:hypothetical protein
LQKFDLFVHAGSLLNELGREREPPRLSRRRMVERGSEWGFEVAGSKGEKSGPVWTRSMAARVLAESDIAVDEGGFHGREVGAGQVFFSCFPRRKRGHLLRDEMTKKGKPG